MTTCLSPRKPLSATRRSSRSITHNTVVPLSSDILARRDAYIAPPGEYRKGDPQPIIARFTRSVAAGALEVRTTIHRITGRPAAWNDQVRARAGPAVERLIAACYDHPTLSAQEVSRLSGDGSSQTAVAIHRIQSEMHRT